MRAFFFICLIILILFLILLAQHTTMTMKFFKLMFHKGLLATHTMKFLKLKLFTLLASLTGRSYYICRSVAVLSHLGVAVFQALFIPLTFTFLPYFRHREASEFFFPDLLDLADFEDYGLSSSSIRKRIKFSMFLRLSMKKGFLCNISSSSSIVIEFFF